MHRLTRTIRRFHPILASKPLMAEAWRIIKAKHAGTAFSGEGAALSGGRWNSKGVKVFYASATSSLAALENLVHINPLVLFKYVSFCIEVDDSLVEKIVHSTVPKDWDSHPASPGPLGSIRRVSTW